MSSPGMAAPDSNFVKDRFAAGRAAATSGIDPEVQALAEGGAGGTQTAQPKGTPSPTGVAPPPAGPSQPNLPLGLKMQQMWGQAVDAATAPAKSAWDSLKKDFIASQPDPKAWAGSTVWGRLKQDYDNTVATGRMGVDAFNLVMSPLAGGANVATTVGGKLVHAAVPFVDENSAKAMLDKAAIGIGPEGGEAGLAGEAAEAGAADSGAAAAAKSAPGAPSAAAANKAATGNPGLSGEGLEPQPAAQPFKLTADVDNPGAKLKVTPEVRQQAVDFLNGKRGDSPIQASLEGLSNDADLNQTVSDVAKLTPKGAIKPDDIRDMNAYTLNLQPDEVMARLVPQYPSDELQMGAGLLVNSAASEFQGLAKAAMENPTPETQEAAVRGFAQLNDFIGKFRDSGTDMGRGMRARQATVGTRSDWQAAIHQIVADVGPENVDEAIRKAAALPDPKTVAPFVSSMRWMGGRDGLLYGYYNMLLSNPLTVTKKLTSDASVMAWNTAVRYAAEKFGSGDVRPGEAAALFNGYAGSMRDGLSAAAKALKEGRSQFFGDYQTMDGRVIESTANHDGTPGAPEEVTNKAIGFLRSALPTSWIGAADDFAKVVNYRGEARALAYRDGMMKGLDGEDLSDHVAQTMTNMPPHIHAQAVNAALRNTFQEPLSGIAEKLQDIVDNLNIPVRGVPIPIPLGRLVMPFVKVPANIARFAYANGPLAAALPSARIKAELAAGGATADLAKARMGLGTAVSAIALPFILGLHITGRGPTDPEMNGAWRRAGNEPYSIKVGGNWYGYNKIEPLGLHLGAMADTVETLKYAHDADAEQLAWSGAFGIGDAMLDKTYMQGMSDFLNALHDPQGEGKKYGDKLTSSLVLPQGAAAIANATDPWMRQHYDLLSAVQARTPGLASSLPPMRDLWGQPIPREQALNPFGAGPVSDKMANLLSPVDYAPSDNAQPIDKWIWDNRANFPQSGDGRLGLTRPAQAQTYGEGPGAAHVQLSDQQLDRLRALTGNDLKDPHTGLGARDTLNALVQGNHPNGINQKQWDSASPAGKALLVQRTFDKFKEGAKRQLLSENPALQGAVSEQMQSRSQALKAPTMEGSP